MMTLPETVQEYSRFAAQCFIQTAVFVDDTIYQPEASGEDESKKVAVPKMRKKASRRVSVEIVEDSANSQDVAGEDPAPDTYDIVNSFAKKQIVCALYQPTKTAKVSPLSDIFPLCKAADVVILDWDLFGDKGVRARELINGLIVQAVEDVPEQLRLILVYTQEANLFGVANEIFEKVHPNIGDSFRPLEDEGGLAFHTDNSRIAVFGKPGRERADTDPRYIVYERDLADTAVNEFAKLASGILHAATLLGLAEIRKNSRKILSRFNSDLDPAFLTHRAMCLPDEDASAHVIPLLVSEIEAVLEDALPNPLIPDNLLKDWCRKVWIPGDHLDQLLGNNDLDHREIVEVICTKGFKQAKESNESVPNPKDKEKTRKAAKILLPTEESDANHRLAHLMASRTFYGDGRRVLKLGTILHEPDRNCYLLCIQPACDSVRVKNPSVFMFVQMSETGPDNKNAVSHVVFRTNQPVVELVFEPKSYFCFTATFAPDNVSQEVVATKDEDGQIYFKDSYGRKYIWKDQLRTSHAQRAVERFASDLSRVGLTESAWLRRLEYK